MNTKQIISVIITSLILLGSISIMIVNNNIDDKESEIIQSLEYIDFTVYSIDIMGTSNSTFLDIQIKVMVTNILFTNISDSINIEKFTITLKNNSQEIAEIIIPMTDNLFEDNNQNITINWQYKPNNDDGSNDLFSKIISGDYFSVDFTGNIIYTVYSITKNLSFENSILFDLEEQNLLKYQLNKIYIPNENGDGTYLDFEIYNPFSSDIKIDGDLFLYVENSLVGNIHTNQISLLSDNSNRYNLSIDLKDIPVVTIPNVFENITNGFWIQSDIRIEIDNLEFDISPNISISTGFQSKAFDIQVSNVNNISTDIYSGDIYMDLDLNITYNIPLDINITEIYLELYTLNSGYLGNTTIKFDTIVSLVYNTSIIVKNVIIDIKNLSTSLMLAVAQDMAVMIKNGLVKLQFFTTIIELPLEDTLIDLSI